jgi:DNA-binding MarR family transcriptional regulator
VTETAVLQAVRLKGRVTRDDLASTLDEDPSTVSEIVERLAADRHAGRAAADGPRLRISPDGRARLDTLLAEERTGIDAAVLARLDEVHARVVPIIREAARQLPRLNAYSRN